jgi:glycosyltransferase involved in cell wall biosynthesis
MISMRILFVADGRSPIAQNWIRYFVDRGDEVHLASTFKAELGFPVKRLEFTPVAFSAVKRQGTRPGGGSSRGSSLRMLLRQWLGPLTIPGSAPKLQTFIDEVQPDLVHALRVPYEGMLAAQTRIHVPLIVSIWGNDFTLHARSTPFMKSYTRRVMKKVNALHADCQRDIRLAHAWGLGLEKPTLVTPGNGGIRGEIFYPAVEPVKDPVIINPRGFRAYVRNDSFFKAIPLVLARRADAKFICASMQEEPQALQWIRELQIENAIQLLPPLAHDKMGEIFRSAQIVVSPSIHDGTPNSLIEAMACGCFPIAGDLESIREWITPGQNGLLVDPNDPQGIADAILMTLERQDLRRDAAGLNAKLISARAEYKTNMKRVVKFYESIL